MWPDVETLPVVHDDTHGAFVTLPRHTSIREVDVQPVVEGAMKHSTQQMHFTLHHLMGTSPGTP
jgi:hypothetical protein